MIAFNVGGGGAQTINLSNSLVILQPLTIDGTTQPGFSGTPLIELVGTQGAADVETLAMRVYTHLELNDLAAAEADLQRQPGEQRENTGSPLSALFLFMKQVLTILKQMR